MTRRPRTIFCRFASFAVGLLAFSPLAGCGGGGDGGENSVPANEGRLVFYVRWPERSKMTPAGSESVALHITGRNPDDQPRDFTLLRPRNGGDLPVTVGGLRPGPIRLEATAYPNANATGTPQGHVSLDLDVPAGKVTRINADFDSTVTRAKLNVVSEMVPGQMRQADFVAFNSGGDVVLVGPQAIQWSSSNVRVVRAESGGSITAVGEGRATITARDRESGQSDAVSVEVSVKPLPTDVFVSLHLGQEGVYRLRQLTLAGEVVRDTPIPHTEEFNSNLPNLIVRHDGKVLALSVTPSAYLNIYDPVRERWESRPLSGVAAGLFEYRANLAALRNYVFLVDYRPPADSNGYPNPATDNLIRYDLSSGEMRRFGDERGDSVSVGWDGDVYVVQNFNAPEFSGRAVVLVYDPETLKQKRRISLPQRVGNVAVNAAGMIYVAGSKEVAKYAPDGTRLATASLPFGSYTNVYLDRNGRLIFSGWSIVVTNENFENPVIIAPYGQGSGPLSGVSAAPGQ